MRYLSLLIALVVAFALGLPALGQMKLPLMTAAPIIDGRIDPAEWAASVGFDWLQYNNKVQPRKVKVYVGATETQLYVAIRSQTPTKGTLAAAVRKDTLDVVGDDAAEVYINPTPEAKDAIVYQFLFNSLGRGAYDTLSIGKAWEKQGWNGGWEVKNTVAGGWWEAECAIPIESMSTVEKGRKTTDGSWKINVTRDWKNPWEWSALTSGGFSSGGYVFTVEPNAPAARLALEPGTEKVGYIPTTTWTHDETPYEWDATPAGVKSQLLAVAPAKHEEFFGARMQRTMTLLATSNESRRLPVRITIFGQSITGSGWWRHLEKDLRSRFPNANLLIENRSVGGLGADILARVAIHQLYPYYPDLVIFHCYGNERDYERIFSDLRRYTTADILIFTHHVSNVQPQANKSWEVWGSTISQDRASDELRYLAQNYNIELVELREEWKQYMRDHNLQPGDLLSDSVHMNGHGQELMAYQIGRHFRLNTLFPDPTADRVRIYDARRPLIDAMNDEITYTGEIWKLDGNSVIGTSSKSRLKLTFEGNRVDILPGTVSERNPKLGTARILIDGKPVSANPGCYFATMASGGPGTTMPGLLRTTHIKPLVLEDWTLRITEMSDDAKFLKYEVVGSVTGPDGTGSNQERFVSKSGRVVIEPQDLAMITWGHNATGKRCYVGFEVTWKVLPLFKDTYIPPVVIEDKTKLYPVTVAQGLTNSRHTLEIIPNGDGPVPINAVQVYRPAGGKYYERQSWEV